MTKDNPPICKSCIEHCEVCDNEKTCKRCADLYPPSDDNTECVDREGNNTKFFALYAVIAIFGIVIVVLFGLCWTFRGVWHACLKCFPWCHKVDKFFESIFPCLRDVNHKKHTVYQEMNDEAELQQIK